MGLFSKKNIDKAKALAEKNKEKIASSVNKATDVIDQKTGGKHADKLKKLDDAAQKFAGADRADTDRTDTDRTDTDRTDTDRTDTDRADTDEVSPPADSPGGESN